MGVGGVIRQGEQHSHQRNTVGDAVVQAAKQRGPVAIPLHQMELPQRLAEVQRHAHHVADQLLQCVLVARRWQGDAMQVVGNVELGVFLPTGRADAEARLHNALAEAVIRQQAQFQGGFEFWRNRRADQR